MDWSGSIKKHLIRSGLESSTRDPGIDKNMSTIRHEAIISTPPFVQRAETFATFPFEMGAPRFEPATSLLEDSPFPAGEPEPIPARSSRGDTFQIYLREIGKVKLLTPEEEIALAERIQNGDEDAREKMIKANLRLVVRIARDYEGMGLPLLDLVSEGNIGLMSGVERFRPGKGAKLSTYVAWWIKQSIRRALANQSKTIRLPVHVAQKMARIRKSQLRLRERLDREATDEEIADDLELNPQRIQQYRDASRTIVSLDSPAGNGDSTPISECVADENAAAPYDQLLKECDSNLLHEALALLDARERSIVSMRFGLEDASPKTFDAVAGHFGVTRERIRQIEQQALLQMRGHMERRHRLRRSGPVASFRPQPLACGACV